MQELEKILEEIGELRGQAGSECTSEDHYIKKAWEHCLDRVVDIIRKHMNDGWIPVDKYGLPKDEGVYDLTIIDGLKKYVSVRWQFLEGTHLSGTQHYVDGVHYWADNYRGDPINEFLSEQVIAWKKSQSRTTRKGVITMTENEAIKILDTEKHCLDKSTKGLCKINCGDCKANIPIVYQEKAYELAIFALKEIQQYREIGTVEECREAVEKQKPKKPHRNYKKFSGLWCKCGWYLGQKQCLDIKYCPNCGQFIDENLEGMEDE